jgi:hypothetical protein
VAFLCVSQQGEFKSTTQFLLGEVHVKNLLLKQIEEKTTFFISFFPFDFFYRVFGRFSA